MRLVSQYIFLYDLIFDVEIAHILFLLRLYLLLLLNVLHFPCLEKLKLMLNFLFNTSNASSIHTNGPVFFLGKSLIFTA